MSDHPIQPAFGRSPQKARQTRTQHLLIHRWIRRETHSETTTALSCFSIFHALQLYYFERKAHLHNSPLTALCRRDVRPGSVSWSIQWSWNRRRQAEIPSNGHLTLYFLINPSRLVSSELQYAVRSFHLRNDAFQP